MFKHAPAIGMRSRRLLPARNRAETAFASPARCQPRRWTGGGGHHDTDHTAAAAAPPRLDRRPFQTQSTLNNSLRGVFGSFPPPSAQRQRQEHRRQRRGKTDAATASVAATVKPDVGISTTGDADDDDDDAPEIPGARKGGRKLAIVFTCGVCDTRSVKQFTERAYTKGVVIVQCPGCRNRHLLADNLGFFEDDKDGWNIEKALRAAGEDVKVVTDSDVLELSVEDLCGTDKIREATETATPAEIGTSEVKP